MARRYRMSRGRSKRSFRSGLRMNTRNFNSSHLVMRGGVRL